MARWPVRPASILRLPPGAVVLREIESGAIVGSVKGEWFRRGDREP